MTLAKTRSFRSSSPSHSESGGGSVCAGRGAGAGDPPGSGHSSSQLVQCEEARLAEEEGQRRRGLRLGLGDALLAVVRVRPEVERSARTSRQAAGPTLTTLDAPDLNPARTQTPTLTRTLTSGPTLTPAPTLTLAPTPAPDLSRYLTLTVCSDCSRSFSRIAVLLRGPCAELRGLFRLTVPCPHTQRGTRHTYCYGFMRCIELVVRTKLKLV